jgi:hypothetical protein
MLKKLALSILFIGIWTDSVSQNDSITNYLKINSSAIDLSNVIFHFNDDFYTNDVFFFGFIHGSEKPQKLDVELLKHLNKYGIRHYAPEVDYSLAHFFNKYLSSGNQAILDFACNQYRIRIPQDASVQFKNKWKEIYEYNKSLPKEEKISIIGLDKEYSKELKLTHIAFIAPENPTGIDIIDSLNFFKNLNIEEINIISGKPVFKSGKDWDYFFGTEKKVFFNRFVSEYKKDSIQILKAFGENSAELKHLMSPPKTLNRESIIYENFKKLCTPLITKKEKIYVNYGYFHIQQQKINGMTPLAGFIKENSDMNAVSIVGMLSNSECLKTRNLKSTGPISIKGTKFKGASYAGYRSSKSWDGDHLFERVNGINILKKISKDEDVRLFRLDNNASPFFNRMLFADFKRGGKKWRVENNAVTNDYFQYILFIKNSKSNIPLEEENNLLTIKKKHE